MTEALTATEWQGGDLRALGERPYLDLGTCINRYGPPTSVGSALRAVDIRSLRAHPYDAEELFLSAYADYLGIGTGDLVAGRGITEFIRLLSAHFPASRTAVVTPDYTDSIRWIANHVGPSGGGPETVESRADRVADAMRRYDCVLLSNPNNPLGLYVPAETLAAICRDNPDATLIVDEAYIDFADGGAQRSMIWSGLGNVVVLLSPNKLFGIAGTRTGVMWTPDAKLRAAIRGRQLNWSISGLDAIVAAEALRNTGWAAHSRSRLLATADRMEALLRARYPVVGTGVPVHYRFVHTEDAEREHQRLLRHGVVVRVFSGAQPGRVSGLRITAPTEGEYPVLAAALRAD
ncbi:aminotransferase class I/II-fold pyridoxal phosphate-dependent enzyme [Amycolatopsis halotolerans]|uniref:Aminotransferase class I/II-fold pyridoxal phosphate-dependent enzyme n=1 Tax=Amycolatopsis halotolerans TaxID=330083 RepID=A0ABV7QBT5_9PSEU